MKLFWPRVTIYNRQVPAIQSKIWQSCTVTTTYHPPSNGKAEVTIKQAKKILKMARASRQNQNLALPELYKTPQAGYDTSPWPTQHLVSRKTKIIFNSYIAN